MTYTFTTALESVSELLDHALTRLDELEAAHRRLVRDVAEQKQYVVAGHNAALTDVKELIDDYLEALDGYRFDADPYTAAAQALETLRGRVEELRR